ncbi:YhcH/YjgK/YiaL family protein [Mycoplasma sp. 4463]|uniref:YhcH/YjgK/YiaL family protein n=1 Tax=Mycoplasma sp. 4463 TaxID=3400998 RepID=UPI003AB08F0B
MIYDKFVNVGKYDYGNSSLSEAMNLINSYDFDNLPYGVTNIDENIRIVKLNYTPFYNHLFGEIHNSTIDIHINLLDTKEVVYYDLNPNNINNEILNENKDNDVKFVQMNSYDNKLMLNKNEFVLFFENETHMFDLLDKNSPKDKIIIKIKTNN